VGALLARGEVALGFQQLSEMRGVTGIIVLGPMPQAVQITTTFSGSVASSCAQPEAVRPLLAFWASAACISTKEHHGMQAVCMQPRELAMRKINFARAPQAL
jgi:molybdate transport system substrate-binding protein